MGCQLDCNNQLQFGLFTSILKILLTSSGRSLWAEEYDSTIQVHAVKVFLELLKFEVDVGKEYQHRQKKLQLTINERK
jgi:hypothetical protein